LDFAGGGTADVDGYAGQGEVAVPAGYLGEGETFTRPRYREAGAQQKLIGPQNSGHGAGEELTCGYGPAAGGTLDVEGGVQAGGDGGKFGGRVRVGEAAAYGAAAPQFAVANPGQRHGQQRHCGGTRVLLNLPLPDGRTHVKGVADGGQLIQARYGIDVDEDSGAAEPHREDRDQ
jgi:hypothetical protein